MTALHFDYDRNSSNQAAAYRGFTIRAMPEAGPENPLETWDCEPPVLVYDGRDFRPYGLTETPPDLNADEVRANAPAIASFLGASTLLRSVRDFREDEDSAVDAVNAAINSHIEGEYKSDQLDLLAEVWRWKGCTVYSGTRNGYSQGDSADVLVVATPDWCEKAGFTDPADATEANLSATADLYAAWAYGDVYGYSIEDSEGEELDSCWGYYGRDFEQSGLAEAAREFIDWHIANQRKARQAQIKTWIKNHVPLYARAAA